MHRKKYKKFNIFFSMFINRNISINFARGCKCINWTIIYFGVYVTIQITEEINRGDDSRRDSNCDDKEEIVEKSTICAQRVANHLFEGRLIYLRTT